LSDFEVAKRLREFKANLNSYLHSEVEKLCRELEIVRKELNFLRKENAKLREENELLRGLIRDGNKN